MNFDERNFYVTRKKREHGSGFAPLISAKKVMSIIDVVFKPQAAVLRVEL